MVWLGELERGDDDVIWSASVWFGGGDGLVGVGEDVADLDEVEDECGLRGETGDPEEA